MDVIQIIKVDNEQLQKLIDEQTPYLKNGQVSIEFKKREEHPFHF